MRPFNLSRERTLAALSLAAFLATLPAYAGGGRVISSAFSDPETTTRRSLSSAPPKITTETETHETFLDDNQSGTGLAVYLGAGGGLLSVKGTNLGSGPDVDKSGPNYQGRLALTWFNEIGVLDLGFGWMYNQITGTERVTASDGSSLTTSGSVFTKSGSIELSPRLRVARHFEIGPMASLLFGTDNSFSETVSGPSAPIFLGLKGAAQFDVAHNVFLRFTASGAASPTLGRTVLLGSGAVELGIPIVGGKTLLRERSTRTVQENFQTETIETETTRTQKIVEEVERDVVVFSFDDQVVHFEFDRATLLPESREFLTQLGRWLAAYPSAWGKVTIEGHTDQRGSEEYNLALSTHRTRAVVDTLIRAGVPADRISSQSYGKSRPVDEAQDEIAHARNRRVEMSFNEVSDARAFRDAINRIRLRTIRPATCRDGKCR